MQRSAARPADLIQVRLRCLRRTNVSRISRTATCSSGQEATGTANGTSCAPRSRGYKIHVTTTYEHAEAVAQTALSVLRSMRIPHKVVRDGERLRRHLATAQAGKFITIYTTGAPQRDRVIRELDPKMRRIGPPPGPIPTVPIPGRRVAEEALGTSR